MVAHAAGRSAAWSANALLCHISAVRLSLQVLLLHFTAEGAHYLFLSSCTATNYMSYIARHFLGPALIDLRVANAARSMCACARFSLSGSSIDGALIWSEEPVFLGCAHRSVQTTATPCSARWLPGSVPRCHLSRSQRTSQLSTRMQLRRGQRRAQCWPCKGRIRAWPCCPTLDC